MFFVFANDCLPQIPFSYAREVFLRNIINVVYKIDMYLSGCKRHIPERMHLNAVSVLKCLLG